MPFLIVPRAPDRPRVGKTPAAPLPAPLRAQVLTYSWHSPENHFGAPRPEPMRPLSVAILRTSQRVCAEAAGILCGENVMSLAHEDPACTARILRIIGRSNARHIWCVVFDCSSSMTILLETYSSPGEDNHHRLVSRFMNDDEGGHSASIAHLAANCPNLVEIAIGTQFDSCWSPINWQDVLASQVPVISKMDTHLRTAFPSLQRITVHRDNFFKRSTLKGGRALAEEMMRDAGWTMVDYLCL
ncbi:hypothetical protein PG996_000521 [Apiospora saccharicola]|uniref:Uncharacterized protein n=1 Tax=Apiospora saccharicola TaxID=335842 RepID=A0ABR1WGY5_9PEZI